jgi:hypothetical protein
VASIVAATLAALDDYDRVAQRAYEAAVAWPLTHGPDRVVDALLGLTGLSRRVPSAAGRRSGALRLASEPDNPDRQGWPA